MKNETTKGTLYFVAPLNICVKVDSPVNQWMIIKQNEMIIYYPAEKKAFQILSHQNTLLSLPFFQVLIGSTKEDFGLTELGYVMSDYEIQGNALISHWKPPENLTQVLGKITLVYEENKITLFEIRNGKGELLSKSSFSNHVAYGSLDVPLGVSTEKFMNNGKTIDHVQFDSPEFNCTIPNDIRNFQIPKDTKIIEVKW